MNYWGRAPEDQGQAVRPARLPLTEPRCYEYCQALASSLFVQLFIISD